MYLETGIASLHHQVVMFDYQLVYTIDGELQIMTAQRHECLIQCVVTRNRHHGIKTKVVFCQRRQDTHQGNFAVTFMRRFASLGVDFLCLSLHATQAIRLKFLNCEIGFNIEQAELMGESVIVQFLQNIETSEGRLVRLIDQEHLLLRPDTAYPGFHHTLIQHGFQCSHFFEK